MNIKRWTVVFRVLANPNRLKIIELLSRNDAMNVGEITDYLGISFTSTSNHLVILKNIDVLEARGTSGHVFYSLNKMLPKDFYKIISSVLKFSD